MEEKKGAYMSFSEQFQGFKTPEQKKSLEEINQSGINVRIYTKISEEQKNYIREIIKEYSDTGDSVISAYVDLDSRSENRPTLFVNVNKGSVGSLGIEEVHGL